MGIYDVTVFKHILGSFSAFFRKWPNTAGRTVKQIEIWESEVHVHVVVGYIICGTFHPILFKVILLGSF